MKIQKKVTAVLQTNIDTSNNKDINISVKMRERIEKFDEAYKLLEEYDRKSIENPEELADAGRLRDSIKQLQNNARGRRTSTSV
jgi:protein-arginine kinase activator protein McsA